MTTIDEGYLRFEFGPEWKHVEQWDKAEAFHGGICGVDGIRALDIIALSDDECLLLEVKDFRDQNDKQESDELRKRGRRKGRNKGRNKDLNKDRGEDEATTCPRCGWSLCEEAEPPSADALVEQVAQKVAGTLAGLVGAARMQDTRYAGDFSNFLAAHRRQGRTVRVVLWIEGRPTSKGKSIRSKSNLSALTQSLKRKVKWLTDSPVQVLSSVAPSLSGFRVTDTRP